MISPEVMALVGLAILMAFGLGYAAATLVQMRKGSSNNSPWSFSPVPGVSAHLPDNVQEATVMVFVGAAQALEHLHPGWEKMEIANLGNGHASGKIFVNGKPVNPDDIAGDKPTKH